MIDHLNWTLIWQLCLAFAGGTLLGMIFYGGLWWTVQGLARARQPMLLVLGSFWLRTGLCLLGFYLLMDGRWQRLLAAGVGFLCARLAIARLERPTPRASYRSVEP